MKSILVNVVACLILAGFVALGIFLFIISPAILAIMALLDIEVVPEELFET